MKYPVLALFKRAHQHLLLPICLNCCYHTISHINLLPFSQNTLF